MKWLIGLDLRPEGRGALGFARWIREHTMGDGGTEQFVGVHVLEEYSLLAALESTELAEVEAKVRAAASTELESAKLVGGVEGPFVLQGVDADAGLVDQAESRSVDAVLIGRRAESKDERWTRLGRVARRVLRALPAPTVVVPPDLDAAQIGDGPVLLATDLGPDSVGAAKFARQFAASVNRPLAVMHIVPAFQTGAAFVPAATLEQLYHQIGLKREKSLETWIKDQGLAGTPSIVASGDIVGRVVAIAKEEKAPLVVCGSRRLTTAERLFTASVGTALAGYCTCPVAVVPSGS